MSESRTHLIEVLRDPDVRAQLRGLGDTLFRVLACLLAILLFLDAGWTSFERIGLLRAGLTVSGSVFTPTIELLAGLVILMYPRLGAR